MLYKPLKVSLLAVAGLYPSLRAMRLPKGSKGDSLIDRFGYKIVHIGEKDKKLAGNLIRAGDDHAKCIRGIDAWIELEMQAGFMIEFDTYRIGCDTLSTNSTMHNELVGMSGSELAEKKQEGLSEKVYKRISKVTYQALRRMYKQRKTHRHPDWQIFCNFIETLPYAKELILAEKDK